MNCSLGASLTKRSRHTALREPLKTSRTILDRTSDATAATNFAVSRTLPISTMVLFMASALLLISCSSEVRCEWSTNSRSYWSNSEVIETRRVSFSSSSTIRLETASSACFNPSSNVEKSVVGRPVILSTTTRISGNNETEAPRDLWRLLNLREWSHEEIQ